jgi:mRNA interferase RelE/StbE
MKTIVLTHKAAKELDAIAELSRSAIVDSLHRYAIAGEGDVKRLSGRDGYRLRVGAYRVIFAEDATTVLAIFIGRRTSTSY